MPGLDLSKKDIMAGILLIIIVSIIIFSSVAFFALWLAGQTS